MTKVEEAQDILKTLGLPSNQQNEISALTLLALCGIGADMSWEKANRRRVTISKGIMLFADKEYGKQYAPNTRETFRRQVLHQFVQARIADYNPFEPDLPTNSPNAHYAVSEAALTAIQTYGTDKWSNKAKEFIDKQGSLRTAYQRKRTRRLVPIQLANGKILKLSPGTHNELQAAIIGEFTPRFAPGAILMYLGDSANKNLYINESIFTKLGISITEHDKLPDIVLYDEERQWLFLIEAVTSHGPMTPKRIVELEEMIRNCTCGPIFVSAFPDFKEFRKHLRDIAWETEVWFADIPDHLIHFNGDKFLGPR